MHSQFQRQCTLTLLLQLSASKKGILVEVFERFNNFEIHRIISKAPVVKSSIWELTKYVLDNMHLLLIPSQSDPLGDEYVQSMHSIYDQDPILKQFDHVGHRRSIVDVNPSEIDESEFEIRGYVLSRRGSEVPHHNPMTTSIKSNVGDLETLDQVANVASHHDTLYSYHFMDDSETVNSLIHAHLRAFKTVFFMNFQVTFTKILDMTDNESIASQTEHDANQKLEFDDSEMLMGEEDEETIVQHELKVLVPESKEILKDWRCSGIVVNEISSDDREDNRQEMSPTGSSSSIESMDSFYKPEADQKEHEQLLSDQVVTALQRDTKEYATITRDIEE